MPKAVTTRKRRIRFSFFGNTIAELKKVIWPTRREAFRLTIIVLIVCLCIGALLSALDWGFARLVWDVLLGGG